MNYMSEVAKMLGVELEEEFEINENKNWLCHFTKDQFTVSTKDKTYIESHTAQHVLAELIGCTYTIKRKPWKPKYYEKYYSIGADGLEPGTWLNDFIDDTLYKIGNCYRTEEEARADSDKWKAFYASDEVLEV